MLPIKQYLSNPRLLLAAILKKCFNWLPDSTYLRIRYYLEMGERLHLSNPKKFTEKLQWLKLYNRKPEYTTMVDKYAVKQYVADRIGAEYVIPTIGVWDRPEDIDFDTLPDKFVLKTTHGGGSNGVVICRDKTTFDVEAARHKLNNSLKSDIYKYYREWPYKNVPRRIIAEQLLELPDKKDLTDYKFFCFNGEPRFLKVDFDRFVEHHANYYDLDWNLLPFGEADLPPIESHVELCPPNFDKMITIARKLSKGHPFLRVDLYNIAGRILFGELTFYPASGMGTFTPRDKDYTFGEYLHLDD